MKNVSAAAAAEQLGVTLISDEENIAGVEIPDTAHQISTGAFLLSLLRSIHAATELGIYKNE